MKQKLIKTLKDTNKLYLTMAEACFKFASNEDLNEAGKQRNIVSIRACLIQSLRSRNQTKSVTVMPVTPAPTAASVIAKSGDCNNTQMIAIIDEYDMKTIIDVNVSLMKHIDNANNIKITSNVT